MCKVSRYLVDMVIVQQLDVIHFGDAFDFLFCRISKGNFKVTHFVTGQHLPNSVKDMEQKHQRECSSISFKLSRREQKIPKQVKKCASEPHNKIQPVKFLIADLSDTKRLISSIGDHFMYITI